MTEGMTFDIQGSDVEGEIRRSAKEYLSLNASSPIRVVAFIHPTRMKGIQEPIVLEEGTVVSVKLTRAISPDQVMLNIPGQPGT